MRGRAGRLRDTRVLSILPHGLPNCLLREAEEQGGEQRQGVPVDLGLTQTELAQMVGASRPAVNRVLQTLAARGSKSASTDARSSSRTPSRCVEGPGSELFCTVLPADVWVGLSDNQSGMSHFLLLGLNSRSLSRLRTAERPCLSNGASTAALTSCREPAKLRARYLALAGCKS